jgi:hypothetical protein
MHEVDQSICVPLSVYEFIQRRSDWKKIEKTVDKVRFAQQERYAVTDGHPAD